MPCCGSRTGSALKIVPDPDADPGSLVGPLSGHLILYYSRAAEETPSMMNVMGICACVTKK